LGNIINYAKTVDIDHAYGFCIQPSPLDIRYVNKLTLEAKQQLLSMGNNLLSAIATKCGSLNIDNSAELKNFIHAQDTLRNINFKDYFNFDLNFSKNNLANT
jgi:hypothetical protein